MTRKRFALHVLVLTGLLLGTLGPMLVVPASVRAADPCSVRVMPLGDSITDGTAGSSDDTGYRRSLYLQLTAAGYTVDFVGSLTGGIPTDFDRDHEGHGGWRADQIRDNVYGWLDSNPADVVLLHIGTNDISDGEGAAGIRDEIEDALDNIDQWETDNSADVWVVLARIINRSDPSSAKGQETTALNGLLQTLADGRIAAGDELIVVDMEGVLIYPGDLADTVHPNDTGYGKMADVWYDALSDFLPAWCSSDPAVFGLSLEGETPDVNTTEDLTCRYRLNDAATTAGTAWTKDGSPHMALYMPMEGGETNGLLDYSGSGHNGSKGPGVTWSATADRDGHGAFSFDHTGNAWIDVGSAMPVGAYSKVAWVRIPDHSDCNNIISGDYSNALWVTNGRLQAGHNGGWTNHVRDTVDFPENVWTFVAVTFDPAAASGQMILYRDGSPVASNDSVPTHSCAGCADPNQLWVGAFSNSPSGEGPVCTWNGEIDDARVYDYALSPEQIAALHSAGRDVIVAEETSAGDTWQCRVTPFSSDTAGSTYESNSLVVASSLGIENLSLTSTSGGDLTTDDLACNFDLTGTATTAATAWTVDGSPILSLYVPMEGGSTNALQDRSGSGHDGTPVGDPAWVATGGFDGHGCFDLDGNDYIDAGDAMPADAAYTKAAWVYWIPGNNMNNIISGSKHPGHAFWITQYPENSGVYLSAGHQDPWREVKDTEEFTPEKWTHVAVAYDPAGSGTMVLYKNGVEVDRSTSVIPNNTNGDTRAFIGTYNGSVHFKGYIDDARIYNRMLSPEEIAALYGAGTGDANTIVSEETQVGEEWQCQVTPFDDTQEGTTSSSNSVTIQPPTGTGDITIEKVTNPAGGTGFDFAGDLGAFTLDDGASQPFTDQAVGDYDVTETPPSGWLLADVTCAGGDYDPIADGVTIYLDPGEDIVCTFTNEEIVMPTCPGEMISYHKMDEASAPYVDYLGGPDANCINCPTAATGLVNGAQQFDGADDEVDVPDNDQYDWAADDSFTIEYWMQKSTPCTGNEVIVGRDDGSTALHWWTGCQGDGTVRFQLKDVNGNGLYLGGTGDPINDGEWHHLVFVRDEANDENRIYVDGVETHQDMYDYAAGFGSSVPLNVGYLELSGHYRYDGLLDEVALYDRALTDAEILQHYNAGVAGLAYCERPPEAPTITSSPVTQAYVGVLYSYHVEATGYPAPTYTLTVAPAGMTIDELTGEIGWTPTATGDYDVVVEAHNSEGFDQQSFVLSVSEPPPFALRINCGGSTVVDGDITWESSAPYVTGGADYTFSTSSVDTTTNGIEEPVPPLEVYKACRHQSPHTYSFPSVPNGDYIVRIHWIDQVTSAGLREIDYDIEGVRVEEDWDVYAEAGGTFVAIDKEYEVTVSDGDGLQITSSADSGDAFESAIEITGREDEAPMITSSPVTQAYVGMPYSYDVEATGYPAPTYTLTVAPAGMTIDEPTGEIAWTPATTGDYDVTVQASNGVTPDATQSFTIHVAAVTPCPLDMSAYWKLDETSSGSYEDSFGDNDGVCRATGNCPVLAANGKVNRAQEFSRASQVGVDIPVPGGGQDAPFDWGQDDSFSIEFWMKRDGPINGSQISDNEVIIGRDDPGTQLHWWFGMWYDGVAHFQLGDKTGDSVAVDGPAIDDGRWHHLVGVRDAVNGINYLYVDGVQYSTPKPSYSGGFDSPTAALNLGWLNLNPGYYYTGLLDEVALYDRALTEKEIKTHYYLVRGYCAACESLVRIMPLGDSITVGNASGAVPDDEAHWVSYRKDLWESLGTAGYDVDFVGSLSDGYAFDPPFDSDHEGHGGWTDSQIRDNVVSFLTANPADVVLLHIGTNGVQADPTQVEGILDNIDSVSEDITVVLARIINRRDGSTTTTEFNDNVEAMALARMDPTSPEYTGDKIIIVDMENGAGIVYDQAPSDGDMWDNLHPYETGYAKMANVWLYGDSHGSDGLDDFLPICAPLTPYAPTITSDPVTEAYVGWLYSYDVEADGYPAPTFVLTESPSDMTVDAATGLIEWTPTATGDYDVTIEASNSEGTDSQSFTINVAEGPACPADMISYWKLDETSGSDFDDYYDGNHASCTTGHCPDFATGLVAGALDFDGSSDYLTVPDDPSLDWANDDSFTVELWAKFTNISGKNKVMVGRDARPGGLHWWVGASSSDGKAAFYLYDSDNVGHSVTGQGSAINDDQWHHLVAIRDASAGTINVYVDGQLVGSASAADYSGDFSATTTLGIGYMAYTGNPDYYYDGVLDEVALYSRALTGDEIEQHYNAGLAGRGYCEIPAGILGDVDGDDTVNSTDALIILSCDVGVDTSQFCPMNCGDVNDDGLINSTDALIILSYDVGMDVGYPVGQPGCPSSVTPCPGCNP